MIKKAFFFANPGSLPYRNMMVFLTFMTDLLKTVHACVESPVACAHQVS